MIQLTSAQEAAFNAAAEAAAELGVDFYLQFHNNGGVSAFAYLDGTYKSPLVSPGLAMTGAVAVANLLAALEVERAKPQPLGAGEVKERAASLIDEYRNTEDGRTVFGPLLDELADRVAAIPVKQ